MRGKQLSASCSNFTTLILNKCSKQLLVLVLRIRILKATEKITGSGSVSQSYRSADPDPYQNVTDPQHCLLPFCSHICAANAFSLLFIRYAAPEQNMCSKQPSQPPVSQFVPFFFLG